MVKKCNCIFLPLCLFCSTLHQHGVQTVVIGDVRAIRQDLDVGHTNNQKLHQWSHGYVRHLLTYKAERRGQQVALQEESYTSKTCCACGHGRKSKVQGRVFHCTNRDCGWTYHRDGVGSINIRAKYLASLPVVGDMAPPHRHEVHPSCGCSSAGETVPLRSRCGFSPRGVSLIYRG